MSHQISVSSFVRGLEYVLMCVYTDTDTDTDIDTDIDTDRHGHRHRHILTHQYLYTRLSPIARAF